MLRSVSLLAFAGAALAAHAATELVSNGGFESGDLANWTSTDPNLINVGSADTGFLTHSGTYTAFFGTIGTPGALSQTLATTAGMSYTLTFYLRNNDDLPDPTNFFQASFGGQVLGTIVDPPVTDYTPYSFTFVAGAANDLTFVSRNDPDFYFLDDVSVTANVSSVPGPLAALPFALMAVRRRLPRA